MMLGQFVESSFDRNDEDPTDIFKITRKIPGFPTIHFTHDDDPHWKRPDEIKCGKRKYRNKKVVFLVRDPRDAIVSNFYQRKYRAFGNEAFDGDLSDFIRTPVGGLDSLLTFYNIWAHEANEPRDFLLLTYEDLHRDTVGEFTRLLDFLGITNYKEELVKTAVEQSSFQNMRKMEKDSSIGRNRMRPRDEKDPRTFKTREGKTGGYREHMAAEDVEYVNTRLEELLDRRYYQYLHTPA